MSVKLRNARGGAGIAEAAAGLFIVIPLVLALVDVGSMVVCQTSNDALAKQCCRAAAGAQVGSEAAAAQAVLATWGQSAIASGPQIVSGVYDPASGQCIVQTQMTCNLPIPLPMMLAKINFQAKDIEPYTSTLPQ